MTESIYPTIQSDVDFKFQPMPVFRFIKRQISKERTANILQQLCTVRGRHAWVDIPMHEVTERFEKP